MFNLGMSELILIAVLALIFIGPKQLPEVAKTVGRLIAEFKKATSEITDSVNKSAMLDELKKNLDPMHQEEKKPELKDDSNHG